MSDWTCSGVGLVPLIKEIKSNNILGLEIGCAEGHTTKYLLENIPNLFLCCVDPYVNYLDWNGRFLNDRDEVYEIFMQNTMDFMNRRSLYRDYSDNLVGEFTDGIFDFIFIDGLHTYEQVTKDCHNYYNKVKSGGIFSGHDYNVIPGVNQAVNEFAEKLNVEIKVVPNDVWYWIKP